MRTCIRSAASPQKSTALQTYGVQDDCSADTFEQQTLGLVLAASWIHDM